MKISNIQIERIAKKIFNELKEQKIVEFKAPEDKVFARACALIRGDFDRELALDKEVNKMLDDLERKNPGEFQRFKMFPLLKKRLAQEKGIVL